MADVSRSLRSVQPAHFLLRIKSFSVFSSLPEFEKYETDEFETGGHKWRLCMYPNGDKERNGNNHISLYLVISDTENLPVGWEINAKFTFFVYDHLQDKYLAIQDGKTRRFHSMQTQLGFTHLISLDMFNNPSNGFLLSDSCAIGAEVFVVEKRKHEQLLTLIKNPSCNTYTWKITNFSSIEDESLYSPEFKVGEYKWKLLVYPNGNSSEEKGKSLSLFLELVDQENLCKKLKIYVTFKLRIMNLLYKNNIEKEASVWLRSSIKDWGFSKFMTLSDLNDKSQGYLVNDTVIVVGEIDVMAVQNAFS